MTVRESSRVRWFLVFWIFVLSAVAFLDRVNISIAGRSIAETYHFSDVQLGWIFSAFLAGYAVFQTAAGRLADRFGPRRVLAAGVVWWGVFTALTAALPVGIGSALWLFIGIRFLLGAGEAVVYPASNQFVARWIPSQERGVANGWIFAGVGAGAGLTPPLITYIMVREGWRSSFWACSLLGVIAGTIWFFVARDKPEEHPYVSPAELATIREGIDISEKGAIGNSLVGWRTMVRSKDVWAITASYFSFGYVAWIFFSWFYIYLARVRGLNLKASAFYAMLPFLAMATCCLIGGSVSDALTKTHGPRIGRCILAAVSIAAAGVFLVFGSEASSARVAGVVLAGGAGALYLSQSSFWSVTADIGGTSSGAVSGFMNMGAQVGGAITASLTPWIAGRFGWAASFLVAAALCGIGAVAWVFVDPAQKLPVSERALSIAPQNLGVLAEAAGSAAATRAKLGRN
ncbi:MAG TPA: MFS transporter [Terriglobales bacterium]|nr:MFS transporter [Terriglobales bacterium]